MTIESRRNILVVYYAVTYPLRATVHEHLYSLGRHLPHRVFYLNLAVRRIPKYFERVHFDLIVFHNTLLSRWDRSAFGELMQQVEPLARFGAEMVALPQDEFLNTDLLCEFINRFDVRWVFPVSPQSEWPKIYDTVNFDNVRFQRVLTGYLEPDVVHRLDEPSRTAERSIDIGYRAFPCQASLGRFGRLKVDVNEVFQRAAVQHGLRIDSSIRLRDVLLGNDWYEFLMRSKYAIGVEGGASVLDRDGSIRQCSEELLAAKPDASFEEVERACFAGHDGGLRLTALSPRHLECCATRTCQVLVSGDYNGILTAGRHYIEVEPDFSNLDDVMATLVRDDRRQQITDAAHREIALAEHCGYPHFARLVVEGPLDQRSVEAIDTNQSDTLYERALRDDRASWRKVRLVSIFTRRIPLGIRRSPRLMALLRRMLYATR